jgi:hypothetical protein
MVPASYLMVRALYDGCTHGLSLPAGGLRACALGASSRPHHFQIRSRTAYRYRLSFTDLALPTELYRLSLTD